MKRSRQLHLWIGLLTSVIILVESVTGLLLAEPGLIGQQGRQDRGIRMEAPTKVNGGTQVSFVNQASASGNNGNYSEDNGSFPGGNGNFPDFKRGHAGNGTNNLMGIVRGLHAGRIGNYDFTFALKITAVGMIILTITGIYLSVKMLLIQKGKDEKCKAD